MIERNNLLLHEILYRANLVDDLDVRVAYLQTHGKDAVKQTFQLAFGDFEWLLEDTLPMYVPSSGESYATNLLRQWRQLPTFIKGYANPAMSLAKHQSRMIGLLEGLPPEEAEIVLALINGTFHRRYPNLTVSVVNKAFPGILPDNVANAPVEAPVAPQAPVQAAPPTSVGTQVTALPDYVYAQGNETRQIDPRAQAIKEQIDNGLRVPVTVREADLMPDPNWTPPVTPTVPDEVDPFEVDMISAIDSVEALRDTTPIPVSFITDGDILHFTGTNGKYSFEVQGLDDAALDELRRACNREDTRRKRKDG